MRNDKQAESEDTLQYSIIDTHDGSIVDVLRDAEEVDEWFEDWRRHYGELECSYEVKER